MRNGKLILSFCLLLSLLTACGIVPPQETVPQTPEIPPEQADKPMLTARVIDCRDTCVTMAGESVSVFTINAQAAGEVRPGMLVEIVYSGEVMESYPMQLGGVECVTPCADGFDNRCALYLQVLEDLWEKDSGLNGEMIGIDLSETGLTASEQAAAAWVFGSRHGRETLQGTWEELADQGYIDRENLYWENGCLFSIREKEGSSGKKLEFDAQKWSSGLGAYIFFDCTAKANPAGVWSTYEIGGEAIA